MSGVSLRTFIAVTTGFILGALLSPPPLRMVIDVLAVGAVCLAAWWWNARKRPTRP